MAEDRLLLLPLRLQFRRGPLRDPARLELLLGLLPGRGDLFVLHKNTSRAACLKSAGNTKCYQCEFDETCLCTQDITQLNLFWCLAVWKSTSVSGAPDNSSLSPFSAMTRPTWLGRAVGNRHRHAIEQASRRWRGGRRDDSARTRRKILISTQVGAADFSCGRVRPAPYRRGANDGAPFVEHWRNPYLKRGVPRGADDLTVGLSTLGKAPPGPPFCPRAGNTSAVHTNGLFATIERAKSVRVK